MNFLFGRRLNLFDCVTMALISGLYQSDTICGYEAIILGIISIVVSVACERRAPYNQKFFS